MWRFCSSSIRGSIAWVVIASPSVGTHRGSRRQRQESRRSSSRYEQEIGEALVARELPEDRPELGGRPGGRGGLPQVVVAPESRAEVVGERLGLDAGPAQTVGPELHDERNPAGEELRRALQHVLLVTLDVHPEQADVRPGNALLVQEIVEPAQRNPDERPRVLVILLGGQRPGNPYTMIAGGRRALEPGGAARRRQRRVHAANRVAEPVARHVPDEVPEGVGRRLHRKGPREGATARQRDAHRADVGADVEEPAAAARWEVAERDGALELLVLVLAAHEEDASDPAVAIAEAE